MCQRTAPSAFTRAATTAVIAVVLVGLTSCRFLKLPRWSTAPPPPPRAVGAEVRAPWTLEAEPLGRSAVVPINNTNETQWRARVRLIEVPDAAELPDAERPAWIFAPGGGEPLEPAPRFTAGATAGWLDEPLALDGLVVREEHDVPLAGEYAWSFAPRAPKADEFELILWLERDGAPAAAVAASGSVRALEFGEAQSAAVAALDPQLWDARSGVEYAPLAPAGDRDVLWCRVPTIGKRALVLEVALTPAPRSGPAGLAHARELAGHMATVAERGGTTELPALLELAHEEPQKRRALLVELARTSRRPLLLDLVLLAPEEQLAAWTLAARTAQARAAALTQAQMQSRSPAESADLDAWSVERAALAACASAHDAGELDDSLLAALLVHLGAVGGEPVLLGDLALRAADSAAFARAVRDEHAVLLEDPRPGVRVRALRWLKERNAAPAEFDPLADRYARRAALDAWRATREGGAR